VGIIDNKQQLLNSEESINSSFIRTMNKDMAALKGKSDQLKETKIEQKVVTSSPKVAMSPPSGLPVVESARKQEVKDLRPVIEKVLKKDSEKKEKDKDEVPKKEKKPSSKVSLLSRIKSFFKSKPKAVKPKVEQAIPPKLEIPRPKAIEPKIEQSKALDIPKKPLERSIVSKIGNTQRQLKSVFGIVGLVVILIIAGVGGFFYWWNYLRAVPLNISHYQCQNNQCLSVEGEGDNQCQLDVDCQSDVIPVPDSLIPVNQTKTIELITDQENLLLGQLKVLAGQEQASSTVSRILVKVIDQEQKYLSLSDLVSALNISIPEAIATSTTENYTLFLYNQPEGNRLGIVIKMGQSDTLVQDLSNWEITIKDDLKQLFLTEELPDAATQGFQDNIYNDIYIRYMNFATPYLSLDYALIKGNLVITTSRESMFAIIDSLYVSNSY